MLLSILIPAYQEEATIDEILRRVVAIDTTPQGFTKEIIVCDDGSKDRTYALAVAAAARAPEVRVVRHEQNQGKGAAIRTALAAAKGEYVLIQDADLEYDVADYPALLEEVKRGADVVYGSRFLNNPRPTGMRTANYLANRMLTYTANLLYGLSITDEATCFKVFRTDLLRELELQCEGFEFCPEVTAKLGKRSIKIVEVPIAYTARAVEEGKKVRWTDGVEAMWVLVKHRFGEEVSSGRSLGAGVAADARRGIVAATGALVAVGVVELVATMVAYTGPLRIGAVARLIPLDATLITMLWVGVIPVAMLIFVLPRLIGAITVGDARARALPGLGARPVPGVWVTRGWALAWAAAGFIFWSSRATFRATERYKEPRLMGMLLAFKQVIAAAILLIVAAVMARLLDRVRIWSERWLGRGTAWSPLSRAAPALVLIGGACTAVLAALAHDRNLPQLRPLIPWRLLLSGAAALAGASGALTLRRRRIALLPRDRRRRRKRWAFGLAATALVLVPLTLLRLGANGDTKGMAISASPLLDTLIEKVRQANDLDGDGFGSLLGENDCAPLDKAIHPGARDVPDDGVDQNCHGGDASLRDLVAPAGEKMAVPDAFRRDWNVLLITIDATRYDHTSFGGYRDGDRHRDTTPRLAELVEQSVSFDWANAPSAGTMASVPAILTSKFFHSGIALDEHRKPKMPPKLKPENTTLPEIMKRGGYHTGAILSHEYFNDWGMEQGVDEYDNAIGKKPDPFRVSSDQSTDRAIAWVSRHARDKWFLWVHYLDPHGRYVAHPGEVSWGTSEEDLYDGELRFTDTNLGRLFDELERLPGADHTIIVITSDHGDAFNEHGFTNHGQALFRELLHVPLIFYVPDLPARVVGGTVTPLDIVPTVADLCGIDVRDLTFEGRSLVPQIFYGKEDDARVVFSETNYPKPLRAAVSTKYKLIYDLQNNLYQLFAYQTDPWEHQNLASKDPEALAAMREQLDAWLDRVMFARDPLYNQATTKLAGVLLASRPTPRFVLPSGVDGTSLDGARVEVIGWEPDPSNATWKPGDKISVAVDFAVHDRPSGSFKLQLTAWLTDQAGFDPHGAVGRKVARSSMRTTAEGYLPTDRWAAGDFIRETFAVTLPADWAGQPGDGVAFAVQMQGPDGKVDAAGQVASGDPHQAVLGVIALVQPAPIVPNPQNPGGDAGVAPPGTPAPLPLTPSPGRIVPGSP